MKKIYNFILAAVALLVFAPMGTAQEQTTYANGMGYSKKISTPNDAGVYTITLEAFTQGGTEIKQVNQPADIVLVLDISGSMSSSFPGSSNRLAALKTAVNAFIDQINTNDTSYKDEDGTTKPRETRLGNTIGIVTFSTNATDASDGLKTLGSSLTDNSGVTNLKRIVNNLNASGSTYSHRGMRIAYNLLANLPDTRRLRTVVLFTDGEPGYYATGNWTGTQTVTNNDWTPSRVQQRVDAFNTANAAISYANDIKDLADPAKKIVSNVFTVSIINNPSNQTQVYLGKVSSNYLGATSMGSYSDNWNGALSEAMWGYGGTGRGTRNSSETNFALTAGSVAELINAFETIGASAGGSTTDLGEAATTVDIISASFLIPPSDDGTIHTDDIHVFTAKCNGGEKDGWEFADEVEAPNSNDPYFKIQKHEDGTIEWVPQVDDDGNAITIDDNIVVHIDTTVSSDGKKIPNIVSVDGFDFDSFFCHTDENTGEFKGYKLIIKIPVKMNPEAVGGPGVNTNTEGSGIYADLDGDDIPEPIITYTPPKVDLPVNIHILKKELKVGESAKFKIQRIPKANPASTAWETVTTVFLTKTSESEEPLVQVRGLDPNYIYQIVEEDWSWSYDKHAETATRTDLLRMNPFIFTNSKIDDIDKTLRHAESKATNDFKGSGSETYVDSKDNGR